MIIGIDLDNTIICYDELFHRLAIERGLISDDFPKNKDEIRNFLRSLGQENAWTEMQGCAYGSRILEAKPFDGAADFLRESRDRGIQTHIISHKTKYPFMGPRVDLHEAAHSWLRSNRFMDSDFIGLQEWQVHLQLTKDDKFAKIRECSCDYFIDDLPEFLLDPKFPDHVSRVLFGNPGFDQPKEISKVAKSWWDVGKIIFGN